MTSEITTIDEGKRLAEQRRQQAVLKAIGLDRVPPEQRELALAIAKRYELDLMLKHLVLVDGRPYVTRDGLLHVAHRSGQLDGIEVTDPVLDDRFWRARCSVYRKDMSHPFVYAGRYPAAGGNQKFAPEMAVKVAEVMALRRAFDISAPVIEERWDRDDITPAEPEPTITDAIAAKRAAITSGRDPGAASGPGGATTDPQGTSAVSERPPLPATTSGEHGHPLSGQSDDDSDTASFAGALGAIPVSSPGNASEGNPMPAPSEDAGTGLTLSPGPASRQPDDMPPPPDTARLRCEGFSEEYGACQRMPGHKGNHQGRSKETWR